MAKKRQIKESDQLSNTQIAQILMKIPDIAEAFTQAEIELAIDDRGWIGGTPTINGDYTIQARHVAVGRSRRYWRDDPLAKQAIRLWTDYCLGATGFALNCDDEADQAALDMIFRSPINKKFFNAEGQQRSSKKLLIDGDLFFMIYDGDPKQVRYCDSLQIKKFITNPNDAEHVVGYRREMADGKQVYIKDWAWEGSEDVTSNWSIDQAVDPDNKSKKITWETGVVIYHASWDRIGPEFGNGLLNCVIDWSKEHRLFMYGRVAIIQALMKFAYKTNVKGGQAALTALQKKLQSSLVETGVAGAPERNPSNAPGANWLQNAGTDLTPMPRSTGAGDAQGDSNQLKLMVCAGTGIMLHYYGDPSTGNLATATAMELPMRKQFEGYQQYTKDMYGDLFTILLDKDPEEDKGFCVDLPSILDQDLQKLGSFLTPLFAAFPEAKLPQILSRCLTYLGVDDVDEILADAKDLRTQIDQQQQDQLKTAAAAQQLQQPMTTQQKEAFVELAKTLVEINKRLA